jgi:hypothetical protein
MGPAYSLTLLSKGKKQRTSKNLTALPGCSFAFDAKPPGRQGATEKPMVKY